MLAHVVICTTLPFRRIQGCPSCIMHAVVDERARASAVSGPWRGVSCGGDAGDDAAVSERDCEVGKQGFLDCSSRASTDGRTTCQETFRG